MINLKKTFTLSMATSLMLGSLLSCTPEDPMYTPDEPQGESYKVNKWIEEVMRKNYLWNNEIPSAKELDYTGETTPFFYSLLSDKDGKGSSSEHYYYSYIESTEATTKALNTEDSYGFEFVLYQVEGKTNHYAKVIYVVPNTPAAVGGLKRGDLIVSYNGDELIKPNGGYAVLQQGDAIQLDIAVGESTRPVKLAQSLPIEDNPILVDTVYQIENKKIGYFMYNHFTTGPNGFSDKAYDVQMQASFRYFATQQLDEFILDFRYNGGGYLSSAILLSSMLLPSNLGGEVLGLSADNKGEEDVFHVLKSVPHLNLKKVYVLVSQSSASASEAVINNLYPFMEVVLIGEKTEGKNVGSISFTSEEFPWMLQPITSKIFNSKRESNYANGFDADIDSDEFYERARVDFYPLGDIREMMLNQTLSIINARNIEVENISTKGNSNLGSPIYNSFSRKQTNGVILDEIFFE